MLKPEINRKTTRSFSVHSPFLYPNERFRLGQVDGFNRSAENVYVKRCFISVGGRDCKRITDRSIVLFRLQSKNAFDVNVLRTAFLVQLKKLFGFRRKNQVNYA